MAENAAELNQEVETTNQEAEGASPPEPANASQEERGLLDLDENKDLSDSLANGIKPDDLPDELWDEESKAIKVDVLYSKYTEAEKRAKGLRDKLARGEHKAPESPDNYELPTVEGFETSKDDPLIGTFSDAAHKAGLSQAQYEAVYSDVVSWIKDNAANNEESEPMSDEEFAVYKEGELSKLGPNAHRIEQAVGSWIKSMQAQNRFTDDDLSTINRIATTGEGVAFLNKLRHVTGGDVISMETARPDGVATDAEINAIIVSPKYDQNPALREKVHKMLAARERAGITGPLSV